MAVGGIMDGGTRSTNSIYEQDDVAYAFVMRHGLIQKTIRNKGESFYS